MSEGVASSASGRVKAIQGWLNARVDTRLGRLGLEWFKAYFVASRNSGCAATIYSTLSVIPAALVAITFFHSSSDSSTAFAERLVTHLKLTGSTASLVHDTFGSTFSNKLAATVTVAISFLFWGLGVGQIFRDVYARAWGIDGSSAVDQGLYAIFFFVVAGAITLALVASAQLRTQGWLVLIPAWIVGSTIFWLWTPRFLLHRKIKLRALLPGALLASIVLGGATATGPLFLGPPLNQNGRHSARSAWLSP